MIFFLGSKYGCTICYNVLYFSYILKHLGIKTFSMTEVDSLGIARVMEQTCDHIFSK